MESFTGSDPIDAGSALFRASFADYYCQQPIRKQNQIYMTYDSLPALLSDSTCPLLYSSSASDFVSSLPRDPFHLSFHDPQMSHDLFAQPAAQVYQFTNNNHISRSEGAVSGYHAPIIPTDSQNDIANAVIEAPVSSQLNRSHISHEPSVHIHSLANSIMQVNPLVDTYSHDIFTPVGRIDHRMDFDKPTDVPQCSNFQKWGRQSPTTAETSTMRGTLNMCSPKYVLRMHLPMLAEKMQQQASKAALPCALVTNGIGTGATQHRQVVSVDSDSISSGNSSGDHHQQQRNDVNDLAAINHMYAERRRRKRQRDCFAELRTIVPNIKKRDKVAVLEHTITFIKELQRKVDELERLHSLRDELLTGDVGMLMR
ncbi:hypothetical protein KP509_09G007100 [Ceratopteris richardii]|uniref:BHLH domain-containing protein n=1 Tax=Ceratopteris richardii TaxID=49495 RepID=A0A8T2TZY9_CERRI|nr:hypothetical protein KP509_09G007100 [Ceratopteris richardii]